VYAHTAITVTGDDGIGVRAEHNAAYADIPIAKVVRVYEVAYKRYQGMTRARLCPNCAAYKRELAYVLTAPSENTKKWNYIVAHYSLTHCSEQRMCVFGVS
jgi:hypothetical protein